MTDPSLGTKKKKITITASPKGVEIAEKALIRLGFDSKSNFAKSQLLARSTVTKFFQGEPIQLDSFKRICEALKLNWREIAGLTEERQPTQSPASSYSRPDSDGVVEQAQSEHRQVTVIDKQSQKIKAVITLEGDVDSVQNWKIIQSAVREYSGDTIEIIDIQEGSIRLFVEGSPEDIERLVFRIKSGELKTVTGFPVEDVQILSESSDDESTQSDEKWRLVEDIVNQQVEMRQLSNADLSDADLSNADLSNANLSNANLSNADLSNANLKGANLSDANLSDANLSDADLRGAYLSYFRGADLSSINLSRTDFSRANLSNADLNGANLRDADLRDADLSSIDLIGANLSRANLSRANLIGADLSDADLSRADLSRADLSRADLNCADLIGADLIGADLIGADLSYADLSRADLSDANLSRADLSRADLSRANINEKTQIDSKWRLVWEIVNQGAKGRDLSNANLSDADLKGADLSDADLRGADLSDADLRGANLQNAVVTNALFGSAIGLGKEMKRDLEKRGAIFGDRPPVRSPR